MHNLYLIVGRTASGKDSLVRALAEKHNFKIINSYATRPKRPNETNEHIFIKPEDVEQYLDDMVAYTKIGDYEYFATKQQLLESDFYIIDPNGVKYMQDKIKDMDNLIVHIIYIAADFETRKHRAISNRHDQESVFNKRCEAEESQFVDFECDQNWDKRIENLNFQKAFLELEQYVMINNNWRNN